MGKIAKWLWRLVRPRISIWMIISPLLYFMAGTALFLVFLTLSFKLFVRPYLLMHKLKNLPGARAIFTPLIGVFWHFKRDEKAHDDFHLMSKKLIQENPNMRFIVSPYKDKLQVLLYEPSLVKEFLTKEASFTSKDPRKFKIFHKSAQKGLTFAIGDKWVNQRQFISETFNNEFLTGFIPTVQNTAKEWIGHNFKDDTNTADAVKKIRWFAAKIGAKLFFGEKGFSSRDEFKDFMKAGLETHASWTQIKTSIWRFIFGSKFYKLGLRSIDRQFNRQSKLLDRIYGEKIEEFKKKLEEKEQATEESSSSSPNTLLEMFLAQNKSDNPAKQMDNADIIGQISTFFSAETNATAAFLTSALYFLAKHKDVQHRLRKEVAEKYGKNKSVDFETLNDMEYLDSFLKETLRLQPPTSLLYQRKVKESMSLVDIKLKKGDRVNVDVLGMGYNPNLFSDPTEFQPDRWIVKKDPGVNEQFAHIPFSEGSHQCPGKQFALTQSKVLICELLQKFNVGFEKSPNVRLGFDFVYHIQSPLKMTFAKV